MIRRRCEDYSQNEEANHPMTNHTSVQERLIVEADRKYEEVRQNPESSEVEINYAKKLTELFRYDDVLRDGPKTLVITSLIYYGYDIVEGYQIYDNLMAELNKKYMLIHPDAVKEALEEE